MFDLLILVVHQTLKVDLTVTLNKCCYSSKIALFYMSTIILHNTFKTVTSLTDAAKGKGTGVLVIALLMRLEQQRFTILEVAADWRQLMIPWHIMRPPNARDSEQLDLRCSTQTYHRLNQRSSPSPRSPSR